ncbi:MAG: hypothetical protein ABWY64_17615 [Tardiphaga sp.]
MGIELDTKAIERRLEGMIQKIDHFKRVDVGAELSHWQTEDMHRHRPFTMRSRRAGRAATIIRPHSLYEMKGRRRFARRTGSQGRYVPRWSTRGPDLARLRLENELVDRMTMLLQAARTTHALPRKSHPI